MIKHIKTDWNDLKSIKQAERQKARLENAGYTLIAESIRFNQSTLTYELRG